jgi:hypothetical protein
MRLVNIGVVLTAAFLSACASTESVREAAVEIDENRFEMTVPVGLAEPRERAEARLAEMAQLFCADNQRAMATDFEYEDSPLYSLNTGGMCGASVCPTGRTVQVMRMNAQFSCS